jgi:hypothetical protein
MTVLKEVLPIFPDEIIFLISKFHGRWIRLIIPTPIKIKVREPRDKRTRKKHLISNHYI